jgi:hypothetical protein
MLLGAVVGITVAFVTVFILQKIGHIVYPPPAGMDPTDTEAFMTYVASMPLGAFLFVLASYFIGTFDGVFIACLVARMKYHIFGIVVGGLMLVVTIANLILIPHPPWFSISAVVGIAVSTIMAVFIAMRALPVQDHH